MKALLSCAVIAGVCGCSFAGTVTQYRLGDHPDGNQNPPPYGLRYDGMFGGSTVATFSMGYYNNTTLTVTDNTDTGGNIEINIAGMLYGGEVDGSGGYVAPSAYHLNFTYTFNVQAEANGWIAVGEDLADAGTLIVDDGGSASSNPADSFSLVTKANSAGEAFLFLADGHRLPDNSSWVGRGWFQPHNGQGGAQDFLFTATLIPAPASACLLGAGGLLMSRRRRD